jgi:hypothetical protein
MKRRRGGRHRLIGRPARGLEWVVEHDRGQGRAKHRLPGPTVAGAGVITAGVVLLAASAAAPTGPAAAPGSPEQDRTVAGDQATPRGTGGTRRLPSVYQAAGTVENVDDSGAVIPAVFTGDIPATVLKAYRNARDLINSAQPGCHLPLELLEAIGKVETNHARNGLVDATGTTLTPILGPVLDGNGFAAIPDTDGGRFDGDQAWDRAVGPMQFIPGTWAGWFADGNGDHRADPHNVYDASLAAARYLCAANRDLGTPDGLTEAIYSYNHSTSYRNLVLAWMSTYANGTTAVPDVTALNGQAPVAIPALAMQPSTTTSTPATDPIGPAAPPTTEPPPAQPPTTEPPTSTPPPPPTEPTPPPPPTTTPPPPTTEPPPPTTAPSTPPTTAPPTDPVTGLLCGVTGLLGGLLGGGHPNC